MKHKNRHHEYQSEPLSFRCGWATQRAFLEGVRCRYIIVLQGCRIISYIPTQRGGFQTDFRRWLSMTVRQRRYIRGWRCNDAVITPTRPTPSFCKTSFPAIIRTANQFYPLGWCAKALVSALSTYDRSKHWSRRELCLIRLIYCLTG